MKKSWFTLLPFCLLSITSHVACVSYSSVTSNSTPDASDPFASHSSGGSSEDSRLLLKTSRERRESVATGDMLEVLRAHNRDMQECYRPAANVIPEASFKVQLTVGPDGRTRRVSIVEQSRRVPPAEACVVRVVSRLSFPATNDGNSFRLEYRVRFFKL